MELRFKECRFATDTRFLKNNFPHLNNDVFHHVTSISYNLAVASIIIWYFREINECIFLCENQGKNISLLKYQAGLYSETKCRFLL